MQNLIEEIEQAFSELNELVSTLQTSGCQLAENECEYRKNLRVAILEEISKGTRVSIVSDLCRGRQDIAIMKQRRDNAQAIHDATQEAINVLKLRVRVLNDQISREWSSGGLD